MFDCQKMTQIPLRVNAYLESIWYSVTQVGAKIGGMALSTRLEAKWPRFPKELMLTWKVFDIRSQEMEKR